MSKNRDNVLVLMISWTNLSIKEPRGQIQRIEEGQEVNWRFRLFLYEKRGKIVLIIKIHRVQVNSQQTFYLGKRRWNRRCRARIENRVDWQQGYH